MGKLRSIQALRGIAALGVVLCHAVGFNLGGAGVDLFFVISGFIIGTVMAGRRAGEFLTARLWRIFPMLWLCSLPWIALAFWTDAATVPRTIASITLWPAFGVFEWPYLRPAWSLCFEMLFYLACTSALLTRAWVPVAIFAVCFVANQLWPSPLLGFLGYPLILDFMMGLALTRVPLSPKLGAPLAFVGLAIMLTAPAALFVGLTRGISDWVAIERVLWWGVPSAAIVYGALSLERLARLRPLNLLGDASYSIYLSHLLVLIFVPGWAGVVAAIAVGIALHVYVEKPLLAMRPNWLHPRAVVKLAGEPATQPPT